jgi:hypothetical protein
MIIRPNNHYKFAKVDRAKGDAGHALGASLVAVLVSDLPKLTNLNVLSFLHLIFDRTIFGRRLVRVSRVRQA